MTHISFGDTGLLNAETTQQWALIARFLPPADSSAWTALAKPAATPLPPRPQPGAGVLPHNEESTP